MTVMTDAVRSLERAPEPDEDWFGEGSSFDSGEELASALFALAGTLDPSAGAPLAAAEQPVTELDWGDGTFDWLEPIAAPPGADVRVSTQISRPGPGPQTWGVRTSASSILLRADTSGWSIRTSVQVLHRADDVLRRLRDEAVLTAFISAAAVFRHSREASRRPWSPRSAA
jgi:hypothetical protein